MESLQRTVKYPNAVELQSILDAYPGWLTAIANGTIENPEPEPTEYDLLVDTFTRIAHELGVYKQERMPDQRYLRGFLSEEQVDLMRELRPLVEKKDDTSFSILTHLLSSKSDYARINNEVVKALHYQNTLGVSYYDAAMLVRLPSAYAGIVADPSEDPSALHQHVALQKVVKALLSAIPHLYLVANPTIGHSTKSFIGGPAAYIIKGVKLVHFVTENAAEAEIICRIIEHHQIFKTDQIIAMATPAIEAVRNGTPPSLVTGTL